MSDQTDLFSRFGGIRPMAEKLGERPSTVQSWKAVGRIPSTKQPEVLAKAAELGIRCTPEDVVFPLGREVGADHDLEAILSPQRSETGNGSEISAGAQEVAR